MWASELRHLLNSHTPEGGLAFADLLHANTVYPAGSRVLEAGCGVGAQTVTLAKNSPQAQITSIDISQASIEAAQAAAGRYPNVAFRQADIFHLPFAPQTFDPD